MLLPALSEQTNARTLDLPDPSPPSASAPIVNVNLSPVQRAGYPTRLRRVEYGGPVAGMDVRLLMDRHVLRALLDVANRSTMGRAQVDGTALLVETRVGGDRRSYEVWTLLTGRPCRPEPSPLGADPGPEAPYPDDATDLLGRPPVLAAGVQQGGTAIGRHVYGKPGDPFVRMYLEGAIIRSFLRKAEQSLSGRVQLDNVGLVVEDFEDQGRRYAVWSLTFAQPRPEPDRFEAR